MKFLEKIGFTKRIEAPSWFIQEGEELRKISEDFGKEVRDMGHGMSPSMFYSGKKDISIEWDNDSQEKAITKKYGDERLEALALTHQYIINRSAYRWSRFRFENRDNQFGRSSSLHYNEETKLIEIQ